MTEDLGGSSFLDEAELGDAEPDLPNIAGDSSSKKGIFPTICDNHPEDELTENGVATSEHSASSDLSPLLSAADGGTGNSNNGDLNSQNGNRTHLEDCNNVSVHVPGCTPTFDEHDAINKNNNEKNYSGVGEESENNSTTIFEGILDVQVLTVEENLSQTHLVTPPETVSSCDEVKPIDKTLMKEPLDLFECRSASNSETSEPDIFSNSDVSEPDNSSSLDISGEEQDSDFERVSDPPNSFNSDYPVQSVDQADVPSAMVNSKSQQDIFIRQILEEYRKVIPVQCTDHKSKIFSHKDLVMTPTPLPWQPYMDIWMRKTQEESSALVTGSGVDTIETLSLLAHPSHPEQKFNKPIGVGTTHDSSIKIDGCFSCADLTDAILPSHDYHIAKRWSYHKEIMEPTVRSFIESYGENNGII